MGSLEGKTLGHFRVERLIGSGGMGAVYEAVDEQLERQVALKVLLREGDSALNQKRFLREARLAAKLTHPNIATVFEVGEFESHLYIVMELLEGQSLRKLLATQRLDTAETYSIARDIARALARAHTAGVTHRDIKPENVFLTTPSPNVLHAKVLDFGLARQQKATPRVVPVRNEESTETTAPGDVLGTPGYWSPEQARSGEVDVRTDIFSFGLVLYEMITGRQAFKANTTVALVLAVTRHEPEPLRKYAPTVAPELEALVLKCIAKDPSQRHADGNALLEAIEAISRVSARASAAEIDDTTADERGPPVARPSDLPRAPGSAPGMGAPTPPATTVDEESLALEQQPIDRVRVFAAIAAGCALAGIVLFFVLSMWGRADRPKESAAAAVASGEPAPARVEAPPAPVTPPTPPAAVAPPAAAPAASVVVPPPAEPAPAVPPPAPVTAPIAEPVAATTLAVEPAPEPAPAATMIPTPLAAPAVTMIPTPLATATPVATNTPAIAAAGTSPGASGGAAPGGAARPRRDKKADCAQPFTVDAKGVKIPKLHCL